jgi:hypothetical protein
MIKITKYQQMQGVERCKITGLETPVWEDFEYECLINPDHVMHIVMKYPRAYIKFVNGDIIEAKMFVNTDYPFCFSMPKKEGL